MYQHGFVSVDDKFVRIASKSYAINKITSVDVREQVTPGKSGYAFLWVIGAVLAIAGIAQQAPYLFIMAAVCAGFGWRHWEKRKPVSLFQLYLVTAAGETPAHAEFDYDTITEMRAAIEEAMSRST